MFKLAALNYRAPMENKAGKTLPRELITVAMLVIIVWGLWAGRSFFVPVAVAALLACTASPVVRYLRRRRMPEWLAVVVATLLLSIPVVGSAVVLVRQLQAAITDFPAWAKTIESLLYRMAQSPIAQRFGIGDQLSIDAIVVQLGSSAGESVQVAVSGVRTLLETSTEGGLIFGFAIFMLASRRHLRRAAERVLERWEGVEGAKMLDTIVGLIERFLLAKLLVMAFIGIFTVIALEIFRYPYAVVLGGIAGVATLVPEVGFVVSLIPLVLLGLATAAGTGKIVAALVIFILVHLVEANYLTPQFVGRKVNLNALATFLGLFAGGLLWGVGGMVLSVPILAVMRITMSASPAMAPWAEFLSEREDAEELERFLGEKILLALRRQRRGAPSAQATTTNIEPTQTPQVPPPAPLS